MSESLTRLLSQRVIAIVRTPVLTVDVGLALVETLLAADIRAIEFTLNSPHALSAITAAADRFGADALVGAGTVLTPADVVRVADAGGRFVVSPDTDPDVIHAAVAAGLVAVPGAFTATEVRRAVTAGAGLVKLFPAGMVGPAYLSALRGPLPDVAFVPTGGVTVDDIVPFLRAGATAVGLGSVLVASQKPLDGLAEKAQRVTQAVAAARDA